MTKQLLAKCGVFVLIVVNLGAYYVFWPESGTSGSGVDRQESAGKTQPTSVNANPAQLSETATSTATPGEPTPIKLPDSQPVMLPGDVPAPAPLAIGGKQPAAGDLPAIPDPLSAGPLPLPSPPQVVAQLDDPTLEKLKKLKASFTKEGGSKPAPMDPVVPTLPDLPKAPMAAPQAPLPLPGLPTPSAPQVEKVAAKAVPTDKSPWTLQWEINDGRTTLTARLNKRVDFRIVCDRVKMETLDGALVAIGKVVFMGPGLKGTCNQLTIVLSGDTVVLEGKAELQVQQGGNPTDLAIPTAELKGEQFSLRLQQTAGSVVPAHVPPGLHDVPAPGNTNTPPSPFTVPPTSPLDKKGP
jgi:hypothetical protein